MTALELIYAVREQLKEYVDDTRFTNDYLLYQINLKRQAFIQQKYNNVRRPVNEQLVQTFIVDLEEIDASDSPSVTPVEDTIMRSTNPLPQMITLSHRNMMERVAREGKIDRPFNIVTRQRFIYSGVGDYEEDQVFATLDNNNYLYLKSRKNTEFAWEKVSVSAVLESPLDELNFESINSGKNMSNFVYPISGDIATVVIETVVAELARVKMLPADQENNSNDDATILNDGNGQQQKR